MEALRTIKNTAHAQKNLSKKFKQNFKKICMPQSTINELLNFMDASP